MTSVLITGASVGLGAAIAHAFVEKTDYDVILMARSEDKLAKLASVLNHDRHRSTHYCCDLTDEALLNETLETINMAHGTPDVIVNNAGRYEPQGFQSYPLGKLHQLFKLNVYSPFQLCQHFLPAMLTRGNGDLIFIGSVAAHKGFNNGCGYTMSKHALAGMVKSLREETKNTGIRVMNVSPGAIDTPSWEGCDVHSARLMPAESIASLIVDAHLLDSNIVMEDILLRPQGGDVDTQNTWKCNV